MFRHGLSVSELCAIKLSDINVNTKEFHVNRLEGRESGAHELYNGESQAVKVWLLERAKMNVPADCDTLFVSERRKPLYRVTVWQGNRYSDDPGLPRPSVDIIDGQVYGAGQPAIREAVLKKQMSVRTSRKQKKQPAQKCHTLVPSMKWLLIIILLTCASYGIAEPTIHVAVSAEGDSSGLIQQAYVACLRNTPGVQVVPSGDPNFDVIVKIASGRPENQSGQRIGYVWATVALSATAYSGPNLFAVGRSSEIQ